MAPPASNIPAATLTLIAAFIAATFAGLSGFSEILAADVALFQFSGFDAEKIIKIFVEKEPNVEALFLDLVALCVLVSLRGTSFAKAIKNATTEAGVEKILHLTQKYDIVENVKGARSSATVTLNRFCVVFAPLMAGVRDLLHRGGHLTLLVEETVCPARLQFIGAWEVVLASGPQAEDQYLNFLEAFESQVTPNRTTTRAQKLQWKRLAATPDSDTPARKALLRDVLIPMLELVAGRQEEGEGEGEERVPPRPTEAKENRALIRRGQAAAPKVEETGEGERGGN